MVAAVKRFWLTPVGSFRSRGSVEESAVIFIPRRDVALRTKATARHRTRDTPTRTGAHLAPELRSFGLPSDCGGGDSTNKPFDPD